MPSILRLVPGDQISDDRPSVLGDLDAKRDTVLLGEVHDEAGHVRHYKQKIGLHGRDGQLARLTLPSCGGRKAPGQLACVLAITAAALLAMLFVCGAANADGVVLAHVASNAELKIYRASGTVVRDGFRVPGDGGSAVYVHGTAACSLGYGAGDDGAQVRDAAGTGCWSTDLSRPISAAVWGVKSDGLVATNDQPAWAAAIAALGRLNNGGTLLMPSRKTCSTLGSPLSIQESNIRIVGGGVLASCFGLGFVTGNGVEVGGNPTSSTYVRNVALENLSVRALVPRTSGANIAVYRARNTLISSVICVGPKFWICAAIDGPTSSQEDTLDTEIDRLSEEGGGHAGVCIGCLYAADKAPISTVLHHLELTNNDGAAEELQNVGGLSQDDINTDFNGIGFWAHPGKGQGVGGVFSAATSFDASGSVGFLVDTSGGGLFGENAFHSLWVASCGTPITRGIVRDTRPSNCIQLTGGARVGSIIANTFEVIVLSAGKDCINMDAGVVDADFSGNLSGCSYGSYGGNQGIYSNGATHWSWHGRIGSSNTAIDKDGKGVLVQLQAYSVYLTGQTDFVQIGGDIGRTLTGTALFNDATGTHLDFEQVMPAQPWIATTPTVACASGVLGTATHGAGRTLRYRLAGSTVRYTFQYVAGSDGTCRILRYSLPFAANVDAVASGSEFAPSGQALTSRIAAGASTAQLNYYTGAGVGGVNAVEVVSGQYERR